MITPVPLWIVASIGRKVALTKEFAGPCETYAPGAVGVLTSIQGDQVDGMHVTVALDPNDPGYWENFAFDGIRPTTDQARFSLDLERAEVVLLPEASHEW